MSHDLIVHNYGPGRSMASIHAEVFKLTWTFEVSHEIIDRIERDAAKRLGIFLVIHMDPVRRRTSMCWRCGISEQILDAVDSRVSIHDFRMVDGKADQSDL